MNNYEQLFSSLPIFILHTVIKLFTAILIFSIIIFFSNSFFIENLTNICVTSLFLVFTDLLFILFLKNEATPIKKGILSFILAFFSLYLLRFIISNYLISYLSIFLGATLYGFICYLLPIKNVNTKRE